MEGPTPVSALIHAATMVTAGVYLIARMHPLFQLAPAAGDVGAIVGALTLLIAGTIGLAAVDIKRVIAYSTMSQIGYMIMGVSRRRLLGGPLPPDDARLLQGAAVHGGGLGDQRDGRRPVARPHVGACAARCRSRSSASSSAASRCRAMPPFSGFFSKDSILLFVGGRGGWHWALCAAGYVGALLTALYTFRMIFRAFLGEPCPEARELIEHGHLYHPEQPTNPANGEVEDTDVGFPGPDHVIAERALPMRVAMALLALLAIVGGIVAIPKMTSWLDNFLAPTFARLDARSATPRTRCSRSGSIARRGRRPRRHRASPTTSGSRGPRSAGDRARASRLLYTPVREQVVLRRADRHARRAPAAWFGRFGQETFERVCRQRRAGRRHDRRSCAPARRSCARIQSGCCASTPR